MLSTLGTAAETLSLPDRGLSLFCYMMPVVFCKIHSAGQSFDTFNRGAIEVLDKND